MRLYFNQYQKEAPFRYGLVRVRDNAESIAFLDEATSALDEENERFLYEKVRASGIAFVSVGHRSPAEGISRQAAAANKERRHERNRPASQTPPRLALRLEPRRRRTACSKR